MSNSSTNLRTTTPAPISTAPAPIAGFNLKVWLETEVNVLGFFNISNLLICLIALVIACCILCCILCCVRYQILKCRRKHKEFIDARNERILNKKNERDKKEKIINGWDATIDQESGATCYHNTVTNETTWDKPKGYRKKKKNKIIQLQDNPMSKAAKAAGGNHARTETRLPTGWSSEFSPEGYKFYHNPETGEVTWTAPPGATGGSAALLMALDAAAVSTGHTRKETVLPSGWGSEVSPEGYKFYHHPKTGEVSWVAPDGSTGGDTKK